MSLRSLASAVALVAAFTQPVHAVPSTSAAPADGTYADVAVPGAIQQSDAAARDDSAEVSTAMLVAGSAAIGLATLFVLGRHDDQVVTVGGTPFSPPGEMFIPPLAEFDPPPSSPTGTTPGSTPPGGNSPPGFAPTGSTGIDTTVTPEPISMALLATGLAGMSGAGLIGRRRRLPD